MRYEIHRQDRSRPLTVNVLIAIVIVISSSHSLCIPIVGHTGLFGNVCKCAVTVVAVKLRGVVVSLWRGAYGTLVSNIQIKIPVVVIVAP